MIDKKSNSWAVAYQVFFKVEIAQKIIPTNFFKNNVSGVICWVVIFENQLKCTEITLRNINHFYIFHLKNASVLWSCQCSSD